MAAAVLLLAGLGALRLVSPDEGRNAEVAREMAQTGDWLVPTYNGLPYLDKPAFHFKAIALCFEALGVNEFAARLPGALFAGATLALVWWFARRAFGLRAAAFTVFALATMPLYLTFARLVIFDVPLTFFVVAAIVCGYVAEEHEGGARRRWLLAGAASCGLATLVKGPVGFIVPFLVLAAHHLVERRPRAIARLLHPWNLAAFLAVVLPWFVSLSVAQPGFARYGLLEESLHRFTTSQFKRTEPVHFFAWVLAAGCLAWSLLAPAAAAAAWRARRRLGPPERFLLVWAVVVVVFFSVSQSKRAGYVLPAVVAFAVLVGRVCDLACAAPQGSAGRAVRRAGLLAGALALVLCAAAAFGAAQPDRLGSWVRASAEQMETLRACFVPMALAAGATALAALVGWARRSPLLAAVALGALPVLFVAAGFPALQHYAAARSGAGLAQEIEARAPGVDVAAWRKWPTGVDFYLRRRLTVFSKGGTEFPSNYIPYALARAERWPPQLVPEEETDAWLDARSQPVFVVAGIRNRPQLTAYLAPRGVQVEALDEDWCGGLYVPVGSR